MFRDVIERNVQAWNGAWNNPSRWAYGLAFPWAILVALAVYSTHHFHEVAGRQLVTQGQVVAHEPWNHNRFGYTFSVDGR
jgi:hypothetical protein